MLSRIVHAAEGSLVALVAALPKYTRQSIFLRLAKQFGISGVQSEGECGRIISAAGDFAVFDVYASTGQWARHTNAILERFFEGRNGTYFDIGANIGLTTIPVARNAGVHCLAFEPDPTNFRNLRQNVLLNCRSNNVTLHNVALFNRKAELSFELAERNLGDHRLRTSTPSRGRLGEERRQVIVVPTARLDDFLEDAKPPVAAKIDTQGAEPFVVEGGEGVLGGCDLLLMEFAPYHMRRLGGDVNVVLEFMRRNFKAASIAAREAAFGPMQPVSEACDRLHAAWEASSEGPRPPYFEVWLTR